MKYTKEEIRQKNYKLGAVPEFNQLMNEIRDYKDTVKKISQMDEEMEFDSIQRKGQDL